jgi:hypothetical protein
MTEAKESFKVMPALPLNIMRQTHRVLAVSTPSATSAINF